MADVAVDYENKTSEELTSLGLKGYMTGDYNAAVAALSRAIEVLVAERGEQHDSLASIYLTYGKSLLEVSREETEALAEAAVPQLDESDDEDEDGEAEAEAENTTKEANGSAAEPQKADSTETPADSTQTAASSTKTTTTEASASTTSTDTEPSSTTVEEKPHGSAEDGESTDDKPTEEATDLQVAWEILELAKLIFEKREQSGLKELAETYIALGEVSLESENFESGIVDIKKGLAIQKEILDSTDRTLAGTYYKLAIALSTNNEFDEAILNFNNSLDMLNTKLKDLKVKEAENKIEIKEIEQLIPEINEKIADINSYKEEATNKLTSAILAKAAAATTTTSEKTDNKFDASSTSKANDISHLVKRKRKVDEIAEECEENATKKQNSVNNKD